MFNTCAEWKDQIKSNPFTDYKLICWDLSLNVSSPARPPSAYGAQRLWGDFVRLRGIERERARELWSDSQPVTYRGWPQSVLSCSAVQTYLCVTWCAVCLLHNLQTESFPQTFVNFAWLKVQRKIQFQYECNRRDSWVPAQSRWGLLRDVELQRAFDCKLGAMRRADMCWPSYIVVNIGIVYIYMAGAKMVTFSRARVILCVVHTVMVFEREKRITFRLFKKSANPN